MAIEGKWYHCERTEEGKKHFSPQFKYCRALEEDGRLVFSDGGMVWVTLKTKWAKLMFTCGDAAEEEISRGVEAIYRRTL